MKQLKPLGTQELVSAMKTAGLIAPEAMVQRVIIDAEVGNFVVVHVQCVGDEKMLSLSPLLGRMDATWRE